MIELIAREVLFMTYDDEASFFTRLNAIPSVNKVNGRGRDIIINIRDGELPDEDLQNIISVFCRYGVDCAQLRRFETEGNRSWLMARGSIWHNCIVRGNYLGC